MESLVMRRNVASRSGRVSGLAVHAHSRAESVAVAPKTAQSDGQPMLLPAAIHEDKRAAAQNCHHSVHPAVIIQIPECQTAGSDGAGDARGGAFESAILI